jgi:hypothetical protein
MLDFATDDSVGGVKQGQQGVLLEAAVSKMEIQIVYVVEGIWIFGGKLEDSVHHTNDEATEESGRVGRLGRQVKVEVELFFKESGLEGIVGKEGNAQHTADNPRQSRRVFQSR